jgi:hypothetical protein
MRLQYKGTVFGPFTGYIEEPAMSDERRSGSNSPDWNSEDPLRGELQQIRAELAQTQTELLAAFRRELQQIQVDSERRMTEILETLAAEVAANIEQAVVAKTRARG